MSLNIQDLEKFQAEHPDYRMELVDGSIIVMSPSGYESDEVATEFARLLGNWVRPRKLGRVTGSSAGFILPNTCTDVALLRLYLTRSLMCLLLEQKNLGILNKTMHN